MTKLKLNLPNIRFNQRFIIDKCQNINDRGEMKDEKRNIYFGARPSNCTKKSRRRSKDNTTVRSIRQTELYKCSSIQTQDSNTKKGTRDDKEKFNNTSIPLKREKNLHIQTERIKSSFLHPFFTIFLTPTRSGLNVK